MIHLDYAVAGELRAAINAKGAHVGSLSQRATREHSESGSRLRAE
jgi:hypothetical protein